MKTDWHTYIKTPVDARLGQAYNAFCQEMFDDQRRIIHHLIDTYQPKRIACMGSGYLNDIPIKVLFTARRETYLIDWIDNISREGVKNRIISYKNGNHECLFCHHHLADKYCSNYSGVLSEEDQTCQAFSLVDEPVFACTNYKPGSLPNYVSHDVTNGHATNFAKRAEKIVSNSRTPKEAFVKAINLCRKSPHSINPIPIESDSIDLVTSSMVVSQFDNEPYVYFSKLLARQFGRQQLEKHQEKLVPLMEELRTLLFSLQVQGHVSELYRLVNKYNGKIYFSVELFRSLLQKPGHFLVQGIPTVLDILRKYFYFEFDAIPPESALRSSSAGQGTSIIQNHVLTPKEVPAEY